MNRKLYLHSLFKFIFPTVVQRLNDSIALMNLGIPPLFLHRMQFLFRNSTSSLAYFLCALLSRSHDFTNIDCIIVEVELNVHLSPCRLVVTVAPLASAKNPNASRLLGVSGLTNSVPLFCSGEFISPSPVHTAFSPACVPTSNFYFPISSFLSPLIGSILIPQANGVVVPCFL